jgi:hypothetical protein
MKVYPSIPEGANKDILERLEGVNLAAPLLFDSPGFAGFVRSNRCAECFGFLIGRHVEGGLITVYCKEHGDITPSNYIHINEVEKAEEKQYEGRRELREPSGKTSEQIIEELGY